jgi:imidazolonepropionase-like amidohydrolase
MADAGASVIKVVLHSGGPALADDVLAAILDAARLRRLPVIAHAEGAGMAQRAVRAGVDVLAHVPFSEHLHGETIAAAVADGMAWISTLAIHAGSPDAAVARTNLERFAAAGGRVLYGTDLGNTQAGPQPMGVSAAELSALQDAGIRGPELVRTLTDGWPGLSVAGLATFVPGTLPDDELALPGLLAASRVVPAEELLDIAR